MPSLIKIGPVGLEKMGKVYRRRDGHTDRRSDGHRQKTKCDQKSSGEPKTGKQFIN